MRPDQLQAAMFAGYPTAARRFAVEHLTLLRELPPVLVPILLREVIAYDWKLPAERRELDRQFTYLNGLSPAARASAMQAFRAINLPAELTQADWINSPAAFVEQLTAALWSSHQMDRFREITEVYTRAVTQSSPPELPIEPRLGIVVLGAGIEKSSIPLFRKLRPFGLRLTNVQPEGALETLRSAAAHRGLNSMARSRKIDQDSAAFRHWYIDGGVAPITPGLVQVSYASLQRPRALLLGRIQRAIDSGQTGPEELRSMLARLKPADIGLGHADSDPALPHFEMSLLTEGAGTQIFATTFVQWAARECARRAQPETLLVRYSPRQHAQAMNAMLSATEDLTPDLEGSLVDADMSAYYTFLNLRRLPGAEQLRFVAWFEGGREAVVIGPDLPHGTTSESPMSMPQVLALLQ